MLINKDRPHLDQIPTQYRGNLRHIAEAIEEDAKPVPLELGSLRLSAINIAERFVRRMCDSELAQAVRQFSSGEVVGLNDGVQAFIQTAEVEIRNRRDTIIEGAFQCLPIGELKSIYFNYNRGKLRQICEFLRLNGHGAMGRLNALKLLTNVSLKLKLAFASKEAVLKIYQVTDFSTSGSNELLLSLIERMSKR